MMVSLMVLAASAELQALDKAVAHCDRSAANPVFSAESGRRYFELAGRVLPDPPPLPDISGLIPAHPEDIGVASILAEMKSSFE